MGYCRDNQGRLCCDICGQSGGVRKHRCPYGYCQAYAICPNCWNNPTKRQAWKDMHVKNECKRLHEEFDAREKLTQNLLNNGFAVRCSASYVRPVTDVVHVLFRKKDGTCDGYCMAESVYRSIELGVPATPDSFRQFGVLTPAPSTFEYGNTTKEAVLA